MKNIIIPKSGVEDGEATIDSWAFSDGDNVVEGDIVAEVSTDKISIEIEAPATGKLHILMPEGAETVMTAVIGTIEED